MVDYTALGNRALSMLTRYGFDITIKRFSPGTFNATLGSYTSSTTLTCTVKGIVTNPHRDDFGDRFVYGKEIVAGDREVLIANNATYVPVPGDIMTINDVDYNVIINLPIEPGGTTLVSKVLVRK